MASKSKQSELQYLENYRLVFTNLPNYIATLS